MTQAPNRPSGTSRRGWVIGRVAGAPLILTPSWLLAIVAMTVVFTPSVRSSTGLSGGAVVVLAFAFVALLFGSVLLHELAHGLVARRRGMQPTSFELTLWGGQTTFTSQPFSPGTSALVAVAGPVTNLVLGLAFWGVSLLVPGGSLAAWLAWSGAAANAFVGLFNLLPGLPLDGGQLVEAAVWKATGDRARGAIAAGWAGRVVAAALVLWALLPSVLSGSVPSTSNIIWTVLIGMFLWSGASAALTGARRRRAVGALTIAAVGRPAVGVGHLVSVAQAGAAAAAAGACEVVVVAPDGRPAAYVDLAAAASVPPQSAAATLVTAVSVPLPSGAVVDADLVGEPLLAALGEASRLSPVLVALRDGRVAALVRTADVLAAIRP